MAQKEAKKEMIMNFKALKFWASNIKRKVWTMGFVAYQVRVQRKRRNAMSVFMFEESNLNPAKLKLAVQALVQYRDYRRYKK